MKPSLHLPGHTLAALTWLACASAAPPAAATEYNWTGGTYIPDFTFPQTLVGGEVLNISTPSDKDFHRWNFESRGVVNWSGGKVNVGGLIFGNPAVSQVWNRGDWIATSDNVLSTFGPVTFLNTAVFRKEASSGDTTITGSGSFVNTGGVIDARSGRIVFAGLYTQTLFNDDSKFIGAGRAVVANGATFSGRLSSDNLMLEGGRLVGNGANLIGGHAGNGVLTFSGGTFGGSWTLGAGTTLVAVDGTNKAFSCTGCGFTMPPSQITNRGTVSWETGQAALFGGSASVFNNEGLFVFRADAAMNWSGGQGAAQFINSGTLGVAANRSAAINFAGGDFQNNGGTLHAAAGATLTLNGSAGNQMRFNEGSTFAGAGQVLARGPITFAGNQVSHNLNLGGVARGGDGSAGSKAVLNGTATMGGADGLLTGRWEIASGATLVAVQGGSHSLSGELTNKGTIIWQASQNLGIGGGVNILTNHGTIDFQTDAGITWNGFPGGSPATVSNHGLIIKTAGNGTSWLTPPGTLSNASDGTLWVRSGGIGLPNGFVNDGLMKGSGSFIASNLVNNGTIAPGDSPGTLSLVGNLRQAASGTLSMELESGTSFDKLVVNGNFALDGTLALKCYAICESTLHVGDMVTLIDVSGELTGSFASITLSGFGSGFGYDLVYDSALDQLRLVVNSVTVDLPPAVPEPETWALMLGGLAATGFIARRRRAASPQRGVY